MLASLVIIEHIHTVRTRKSFIYVKYLIV
jgi:hypothetical protein